MRLLGVTLASLHDREIDSRQGSLPVRLLPIKLDALLLPGPLRIVFSWIGSTEAVPDIYQWQRPPARHIPIYEEDAISQLRQSKRNQISLNFLSLSAESGFVSSISNR